MTRRRTIERRLAGMTISTAVLFAIASLAWRFEIVDQWSPELPYVPNLEGLEAFWLYVWFVPILIAIAIAMLLVALLRWIVALPVRWPRMTVVLPLVGCGGVAWLYVPFFFVGTFHVDRVHGWTLIPSSDARAVAALVIVSMLLAMMLIAVTEMRRTPLALRMSSRTVVATLALLLAHCCVILTIFPFSDEWWPRDKGRGLLVPLRPCRGALVWRDGYTPYERIDDVWLHFLDPRLGHQRVHAVSLEGRWREEYTWLRLDETKGWFVRSDDPAVVRCDDHPRAEVVAPAPWHRLGE